MKDVRALFAILLILPTVAQAYTIEWDTLDGGGTMNATAGGYTLSGTIGQPDAAAPQSAGNFSLHAGFWVKGVVNRPPVAQSDTFNAIEDTPASGDVLADNGNGPDSDPDNDVLTVNTTPVSGPSNGVLTLNANGTFTYTPNTGFNGVDTFEYEVCDDSGIASNCDTAVVTINVGAVNDPPVAQNGSFNTAEDSAVSGNVLAHNGNGADTDPEGNPLTVNTTPVSGPANGVLALNADGSFTYTPAAGFNGTDQFVYGVKDGNGGRDQATVTLNVGAVNDPPAAAPDSYATMEGIALDATAANGVLANDSDLDGPGLTASLVTAPVNAQSFVLNADGAFSYTPTAGFTGTDSFVYEAADGAGGTDQATATITVSATPVSPVQVQVTGNGQGQVTSQPAGINCPGDCGESFAQDTVVILTAVAEAGSTFTGWANCPQAADNQCTVTVGAGTITVTATFEAEAQAQATPIPALDWWALVLLTGMIGFAAGAARGRFQ